MKETLLKMSCKGVKHPHGSLDLGLVLVYYTSNIIVR